MKRWLRALDMLAMMTILFGGSLLINFTIVASPQEDADWIEIVLWITALLGGSTIASIVQTVIWDRLHDDTARYFPFQATKITEDIHGMIKPLPEAKWLRFDYSETSRWKFQAYGYVENGSIRVFLWSKGFRWYVGQNQKECMGPFWSKRKAKMWALVRW